MGHNVTCFDLPNKKGKLAACLMVKKEILKSLIKLRLTLNEVHPPQPSLPGGRGQACMLGGVRENRSMLCLVSQLCLTLCNL